ncbi:YrhK family protein [Falsirhodobacter sp. alg1]|uniref:YrhK family protein n=1 Tax=Falsirhodobacter sp. alg1 TaxID=1472418 RepID=UPI000A4CDE5A|nr:YrhK family protein [Falsirhodobacter sp. alg1]
MSLSDHLFRHEHRETTAETRKLYARFEIAHTLIDFGAAAAFLVGSILFFFESWQTTATWLFTIGSVLFAMKPTLRLWREVRLYYMGRTARLAKRTD